MFEHEGSLRRLVPEIFRGMGAEAALDTEGVPNRQFLATLRRMAGLTKYLDIGFVTLADPRHMVCFAGNILQECRAYGPLILLF